MLKIIINLKRFIVIITSFLIATKAFANSPTQTQSNPPELATWVANMVTYGQQDGIELSLELENGDMNAALAATYYDAARVYYQIADYTGDPAWNTYAEYAVTAYRDNYVIPNNGGIPGYWNFTTGLRLHFERTGDVDSKNAAILLSQKAAYTSDTTPLLWTVPSDRNREVAYAINSYIDAELLGEPRRDRLAHLFEQALGHLDQFLATGDSTDYAPFMFALTAEALIRYFYHVEQDERIITKIALLADWTWSNAWIAEDEAFYYRATDKSRTTTDLNLLIAPLYAWLYHETGNINYREQADQIFAGGVKGAWLSGVKQFNQNYRLSFDYLTWRSSLATRLSPPSLTIVGNDSITLTQNESVSLILQVSDADNGTLSYSVEPTDFVTLTQNNDNTLTLTLNPTHSNLGNHTIIVTATDHLGFSGSVSISVSVDTPTTTFSTWLASYNPTLTGNNAHPDADPDGNGISNFYEYAFDFDDPGSFNNMVPVFSLIENNNEQWATLTWRRNNFATDVIYQVQVSQDLITWTPITIDSINIVQTVLNTNIDGDSSAALIETRVNVSSSNDLFLRLHLE